MSFRSDVFLRNSSRQRPRELNTANSGFSGDGMTAYRTATLLSSCRIWHLAFGIWHSRRGFAAAGYFCPMSLWTCGMTRTSAT